MQLLPCNSRRNVRFGWASGDYVLAAAKPFLQGQIEWRLVDVELGKPSVKKVGVLSVGRGIAIVYAATNTSPKRNRILH